MYESPHVARDKNLPNAREQLKESIEEDLAGDPFILAVFYGGSIGSDNSDCYSDIDLRLIIADEVFEQYVENKENRAARWGNLLFFESTPYSSFSAAHYDSFVKVEIFYYRLKDVLPSFWLRNIEVFYDSTEMLADIVAKSRQLVFEPSLEDVELWRTKFFSSLHELYRRMMRGELYYALSCLDTLRFLMATGWYMEKGIQPNALNDWAKIEGNRSPLEPWQLEELSKWDSNRNPQQMMDLAFEITGSFKKLHHSLCKRVQLDESPALVEKIIRKVF